VAVQQEAQAQWEDTREQYHRKYDQYRINFRLLVGTLKYRLIERLWAKDFQRHWARYQKLLARLVRSIVPVIPGRKAPRCKKRTRTNKFVITLRRC